MSCGKAIALAALLFGASGSWALGLGDIELGSALNERLDADIELLDAAGLQPSEIIVSLASADDFERVGVERFFFLTDLRFEVAPGGTIRVSSTQPITEPYLNFLVEVLWPSGRLLKEYTLLLDPPTFSPAPAPTVSAPAQRRAPDSGVGRVERAPVAASSSRGTSVQLAPPRQQQPSPLDDGVVDGEYRMTDRADTLWNIASRTRPSEAVTVGQNMLAIQRMNPEAFLNDNINLMKAGYTLKLPTEQEALSVSVDQAAAQVAMQNEDWRALRNGETPAPRTERVASATTTAQPALQAQLDATPARPRAQQTTTGPNGELRIVAGADNGTAGGTGADVESLNAALEEQDRLSREVEELNEQLGREQELASDQIAVKDRQLEVKDQQIAEMQAEMARMRQEMAQTQASADQNQNQSASETAAWWESPYVLGGAAVALVLLLVMGLRSARRRRAEESESYYPEVTDAPAFDAGPAAPLSAGVATEVAGEPVFEPAPEAAPAVAATLSADADAEEVDSETGDVIGEADIYIAYGRYPQAIGLLLGVLEDDPGRNDVRLKLLELYAETRDREAFETHRAALLERCEDEEALQTANELAGQFGATEEPVEGEPTLSLEDDAGGTDDLALDMDTPLDIDVADESRDQVNGAAVDAFEEDAAAGDEAVAAADDDFELELDDLSLEADESTGESISVATTVTNGSAGAELGGDLGMDFDPERDALENGSARVDGETDGDAIASENDLDLDLDLEQDGAETLTDDAFDFEDEGDTAGTKLDLARAYIDMGDQDGARDILKEVVTEGSSDQQHQAQTMLEEL